MKPVTIGTRTRCAGGILVCAVVLGLGISAGAQVTSDDGALAIPVNGQIAIVDMGKAETHMTPTPVVSSASTAQRQDLDITLPVLGIPLRGQASMVMEAHMTMILVAATVQAQGKTSVVLHGPAGDATVLLTIDQPVSGTGAYDPAEATVHIRGTGGTGMFDGVRIRGDLRGAFKPAGTLYLGYPSADAALLAVERGLAQNSTLTDAQRAEALGRSRQALAKATLELFPSDENAATPGQRGGVPKRAAVTSAIRRTGTQAQVILRIVVPQGDARQPVKVVAVGPDGRPRAVHQASHTPGETVSVQATGTPPFVVLVYVGDVMVRQVTVPSE